MSVPQVQNIYRLSFLQEGLLFHSVENSEAAFYVDQVVYRLIGDLDLDAFTKAWSLLTERHAVLRTSFHWQGISELVQVVHDSATVPVEQLDWRTKSPDELEAFLREDRLAGFSLERPPLIRLALIQVAELEYRLVFRYHHMLLDAWSGLMVLNEAFGYYDRIVAGEQVTVAPARSFHDYVLWVRDQDLAAAEQYWRRTLAGVTEPTLLPVISAVTPTGDRDNPEEISRVPAGVVARLEEAARRHQVTLGALLQTCWALLLSRYTGRDDVVFGATMSSRPPELEGVTETVGLFISTLPVRARLHQADSVAQACRRLQGELAELRQFDYSPLAQVQQWAQVPPGTPLFDTIMTVLNVPGIDSLQSRDGAVALRDGSYRYRTNYPLSLLVIPESGELTLRMAYDPGRVHADDVVRLLGHLSTIIEAVSENPEQPLAEVPMVTGAERELLLTSWAGRSVRAVDDRLAHQLIEEISDRLGDTIAIRHGDTEVTYSELESRANQLAHHLRSIGVGPDTRVGLCLPRSIDQIVSMLAVLKAGGCFLPLDAAYPQQRLEAIVSEAAVAVLVTDKEHRGRLPRTGGRTVLIDAHRASIAEQPTERPKAVGRPADLAYVIYTSGSTGRPKGVMVPHEGLSNLVRQQAVYFGLQPGDRVLQWASASFDASVFEVVLALGVGATLHVADQERVAPGRNLAELLRGERITALTITPSALAATSPEELPDLRLLILAGEALSSGLVRAWADGRRVVNAYGPTETSVWATAADCVSAAVVPPIGRPVGNLIVRVLDEFKNPVPVGVKGELFIGGKGLARGYLGQPEQTAQRFVPDPFGSEPGARLYRTGDLVRWRADGQLEFVGRQDSQVKVRGFRIEAGEVEAALRDQEGVVDCVVVARATDGDGPADTLVAYVVGRAGETAALKERLGQLLPEYMVPSIVIPLERLPLTPNGKLDEKALPSMLSRAAPARQTPRSTAEKAIAALWAEVLRVDDIDVTDDFFDLGGNSIKATQVVSRIRRTWQLELPVRAVFQARTVEQFALILEAALLEQLEAE